MKGNSKKLRTKCDLIYLFFLGVKNVQLQKRSFFFFFGEFKRRRFKPLNWETQADLQVTITYMHPYWWC